MPIGRKNAYLVNFSEERAKELYVVREALEGMATRLAALNLTEKHIDQLRKALDKQSGCLTSGDTEGYAVATIKFHNTILEATGNKTLERSLHAIYSQMEALRLRTLYLPTRLRQSFAEHQQIFQAFLKRDPDLCERAARKHIAATTTYAIELLAKSKKKFEPSDA